MADLTRAVLMDRRQAAYDRRGESITYRRRSDSVNLTTGVVTESNTDTAITACLISDVDADRIARSGGQYITGDRHFRIRTADLPETPPKTTSQIVSEGTTYNVERWWQSPDTNEYMILGRKP